MAHEKDIYAALWSQPLSLPSPPSPPRDGRQIQICLNRVAHRLAQAFSMLPATNALEARSRFKHGLQYEMVSTVCHHQFI